MAMALGMSVALLASGCQSMDQIAGPVVAGGVGFGAAKLLGAKDSDAVWVGLASAATVFVVQQYRARKASEAELRQMEEQRTKPVVDNLKARNGGKTPAAGDTKLAVPVGKTTTAEGAAATEYAITDPATGKVIGDEVLVISDADAQRAVAEQEQKKGTTQLGQYKVVMLEPTTA